MKSSTPEVAKETKDSVGDPTARKKDSKDIEDYIRDAKNIPTADLASDADAYQVADKTDHTVAISEGNKRRFVLHSRMSSSRPVGSDSKQLAQSDHVKQLKEELLSKLCSPMVYFVVVGITIVTSALGVLSILNNTGAVDF